MNVLYEVLNEDINKINDVDKLRLLRIYNDRLREIFNSLVIEDTEKNIFEGCVEYIRYTKQIQNVIEKQLTKVLYDMERCQPTDED